MKNEINPVSLFSRYRFLFIHLEVIIITETKLIES